MGHPLRKWAWLLCHEQQDDLCVVPNCTCTHGGPRPDMGWRRGKKEERILTTLQ
jgi:hypothetical protein